MSTKPIGYEAARAALETACRILGSEGDWIHVDDAAACMAEREVKIRDEALEVAACVADEHWPEAGHVPAQETNDGKVVSCAMTISVVIRRMKSAARR